MEEMTASEILRRNADDNWSTGVLGIAFDLNIDEEVYHDSRIFRILADKIDAELDEAKKKAAHATEKPLSEVMAFYTGLYAKGAEPIGDWLDRWFIPRPRFEDGEPVQFGDSPVGLDGVEKFIFTRSCGGSCQMQDANGNMLTVFPSERVKRRAPEVLGADGLPLDEDDTVYGMDREQHRYTVQVPYSINEAVGQRFCVQCYDHDEGNITWCDPSMLTHTPPDTLERLRDDMLRTAEEWREADSVSIIDMNHWANRLTALIERKGGE